MFPSPDSCGRSRCLVTCGAPADYTGYFEGGATGFPLALVPSTLLTLGPSLRLPPSPVYPVFLGTGLASRLVGDGGFAAALAEPGPLCLPTALPRLEPMSLQVLRGLVLGDVVSPPTLDELEWGRVRLPSALG